MSTPGTLTTSVGFSDKVKLFVTGLLLLLFLLFPLVIWNEFYRDIMILVLVFAIASQAWNIVGGYGGQFSLGHAVFFGLGAYTSSLLYVYYGLTPWIGMILGGFYQPWWGGWSFTRALGCVGLISAFLPLPSGKSCGFWRSTGGR